MANLNIVFDEQLPLNISATSYFSRNRPPPPPWWRNRYLVGSLMQSQCNFLPCLFLRCLICKHYNPLPPWDQKSNFYPRIFERRNKATALMPSSTYWLFRRERATKTEETIPFRIIHLASLSLFYRPNWGSSNRVIYLTKIIAPTRPFSQDPLLPNGQNRTREPSHPNAFSLILKSVVIGW